MKNLKKQLLVTVLAATMVSGSMPMYANKVMAENKAKVVGVEKTDEQKKVHAQNEQVSMYRVYNPNSGEHFYTASAGEKKYLVRLGWHDEGIGWTAPKSSDKPVYRLYNKRGGEHHYTLKKSEWKHLISVGWKDEGIGWYSDEKEGVPVYRQYNPNAFANNHNYTTNAGEKNHLVKLGWRDEGIGWYGICASDKDSEKNIDHGTNKDSRKDSNSNSEGDTNNSDNKNSKGTKEIKTDEGTFDVRDNVIEAQKITKADVNVNGSSVTAQVPSNAIKQSVVPGSILVFPASEEYPSGTALKVSSVNTSGGMTTYTGTTPNIYEVFSSVDLNAMAEPVEYDTGEKWSNEYVQLDDIVTNTSSDLVGASYSYSHPIEEYHYSFLDASRSNKVASLGISGTFSILNPTVDVNLNVDFPFAKLPEVHKASVAFNMTPDLNLKFTANVDKKIALKDLRIPLNWGFAVTITPYILFNANGEISFDYRINSITTVSYSSSTQKISCNEKVDGKLAKIDVKASAAVGSELATRLIWGANVKKEDGTVANINNFLEFDANMQEHLDAAYQKRSAGKPSYCADMKIYPTAYVQINDECVTMKIIKHFDSKAQLKYEILKDDKENMYRKTLHVEDGEIVSKCTYGNKIIQLQGIIKNSSRGTAVNEAKITIISAENSDAPAFKTQTGVDGKFSFSGQTGKYKLSVTRFGYEDYNSTFELADNINNYNVSLKTLDITSYLGQDWNQFKGKFVTNEGSDQDINLDTYVYYDAWLHKDNKITGILTIDPNNLVEGVHPQDSLESAITTLKSQGFKNYKADEEVTDAWVKRISITGGLYNFHGVYSEAEPGELGLSNYGTASAKVKQDLNDLQKKYEANHKNVDGSGTEVWFTFKKDNIGVELVVPMLEVSSIADDGERESKIFSTNKVYKVNTYDVNFDQEAKEHINTN